MQKLLISIKSLIFAGLLLVTYTTAYAEGIGFKGIVLGMTPEQINDLVENSEWYYVYGDIGKEDRNKHTFLSAKKSKIGCKGQGDYERCFYTGILYLEYHDNRLMRISIPSPKFGVREIELEVKEWCGFAYQALSEKYSLPTKIFTKPEDINILTFKDRYTVFLAIWTSGKNSIKLSITQNEYKFGCKLLFEDTLLADRQRAAQSKRSSEF